MNVIGQLLLWAGFLSGSLATVLNLENATDKWATINWPWYLSSIAICVVGIVVLRMGAKPKKQDSEKSAAGMAEIKSNLENLIRNLGQLKNEMELMPPSHVVVFIDDKLAGDCRSFADGREAIILEMGLQKFADVMSQFAAGERSINRAWSASADGYVDEAATCIERSETMMANALKELGK